MRVTLRNLSSEELTIRHIESRSNELLAPASDAVVQDNFIVLHGASSSEGDPFHLWFGSGWEDADLCLGVNHSKVQGYIEYADLPSCIQEGPLRDSPRLSEMAPTVVVQELNDDFTEGIQGNRWLLMRKQWGGPGNNGVVEGNVALERHVTPSGEKPCAVLYASGDLCEGRQPIGVTKSGAEASGPDRCKRVGGVICTRDHFEAGTSFETRLKIEAPVGVCAAMWTFHYEEHYPAAGSPSETNPEDLLYHPEDHWRQGSDEDGWYTVDNHEIDIEVPGTAGPYCPLATSEGGPMGGFTPDFRHARLNTFVGETEATYTGEFQELPSEQNDKAWHLWRFDWHARMGEVLPDQQVGLDPGTGLTVNLATHNPCCRTADGWREPEGSRVEFFIDGVLVKNLSSNVPVRPMNLTIGLWFPLWAMAPGRGADFDRAKMVLDYVRVAPLERPLGLSTPCISESFPGISLLEPVGLDTV